MQPSQLSFTNLILEASPLVQIVMLILLAMSVASWAVIYQRTRLLREAKNSSEQFEERFWSGIDLNRLYQECSARRDELTGMEQIFFAGFKEFARLHNGGPRSQEMVMDGTYRAMRVSLSREVDDLETGLPLLATVGSISPYIGLFGTVWGIMHAFIALGAVKQATLQMVAPGIAEALIATAIGLFAAIPAVMAYNRLNQRVNKLELNYDNFMEEFTAILHRQAFTVSESNKG